MTDPQAAARSDDAAGVASDGRSPVPDSPATASGSPAATSNTVTSNTVTSNDVAAAALAVTPGPTPGIPGHISIAPRVLQKVGGAVVGESLSVDHRDVRVDAQDDDGRLALHISTPMGVPALSRDVVVADGGVLGAIRSLQETVTSRLLDITGRAVSRVDVTVTASRLETTTKGRVR